MGILKRLLGRQATGRAPHDHVHDVDDVQSPGWDAISSACDRVYGAVEPVHWGTIIKWRMGGPDPLDGISAYRAAGPPPHWHFVSYGLSELYDKESDDPTFSGWGIELTFRLIRHVDDAEPPVWAFNLMQNLARYVFESGNVLRPGDHMDINGPIALEEDTEIRALLFALDRDLGEIHTPNGAVGFVQIVGVHLDEYEAASEWDSDGVLESLAKLDPQLVTDLERPSILSDPTIRADIEARRAGEGSSMSGVNVDVLRWSLDDGIASIAIGALAVERVRSLLAGRILHGRPFWIRSADQGVTFLLDAPTHVHGTELRLAIDAAAARALIDVLRPVAGVIEADAAPGMRWIVEPTIIRDDEGREVGHVG